MFINDSCDTIQSSGVNKNVIVRNALGCLVTWQYNIDTPDVISVTVPPMQTRCKSDTTKDPETIQVSSSNPGLLVNLGFMNKPGTDSDTASSILRGVTGGVKNIIVNYSNVVNGKRCPFPYQFTVTEPDTLVLRLVQKTDPSCSYNFDGKFDVALNVGQRGNSPLGLETYNYQLRKNNSLTSQLDAASTNVSFGNLDSGIYTLLVLDPKGCTHSFVDTLKKPDTFKVGFSLPVNANCLSVANGSITVSSFTGEMLRQTMAIPGVWKIY